MQYTLSLKSISVLDSYYPRKKLPNFSYIRNLSYRMRVRWMRCTETIVKHLLIYSLWLLYLLWASSPWYKTPLFLKFPFITFTIICIIANEILIVYTLARVDRIDWKYGESQAKMRRNFQFHKILFNERGLRVYMIILQLYGEM